MPGSCDTRRRKRRIRDGEKNGFFPSGRLTAFLSHLSFWRVGKLAAGGSVGMGLTGFGTAGLPPAAGFLFARQKESRKRKSARGTFRMVPRAPSSRPRGAECPPLDPPAYVSRSRCSAQNSRPPSPPQRVPDEQWSFIAKVDDIASGKDRCCGSRNGERCQSTDKHPEKPLHFARSAVRDGRLTPRTRSFPVAPMPPSLQRPPHRGAGAKPRRAAAKSLIRQPPCGRRRLPPVSLRLGQARL